MNKEKGKPKRRISESYETNRCLVHLDTIKGEEGVAGRDTRDWKTEEIISERLLHHQENTTEDSKPQTMPIILTPKT